MSKIITEVIKLPVSITRDNTGRNLPKPDLSMKREKNKIYYYLAVVSEAVIKK